MGNNLAEQQIRTEVDDLVALGNEIICMAESASSKIKGTELSKISMWVTRVGSIIEKLILPDKKLF